MRIDTVKVYDLEESIIASGLPMMAEYDADDFDEKCTFLEIARCDEYDTIHGNPHFKRMAKLADTPIGSGHANALSGILVSMNVTATVKWWEQFQRYHFKQIVSSASTMHRLRQMMQDGTIKFNKNTNEAVISKFMALLNDETVTLTKDGVAVDFKGTLSENGMVYTLDADLADGFYTLTVADDVKNTLGVPMQADFTYDFAVGDVYGIKTADGAAVDAIAANTSYVVTEPVAGNTARIAIVAIYDASNNVLAASAIENIPADYAKKYAEVEITTPETLPEGSYYVRYFLWDANTLMPALNESIKVFE
jgi:hypothetical protein